MSLIKYIPDRVIDTDGIADGASIYVYQTKTTTPVSLYLDDTYSSPTTNPYVVAAGAAVPPLYHNYDGDVRVKIVTLAGTIVDDDPYDTIFTSTSAFNSIGLQKVATRTELAAIPPRNGMTRYLLEAGREGTFVFSSTNLSSQVTVDAQQGIYVAPATDTSGASGAWVRKFTGLFPSVRWWGAVGDGVTNDYTAITAAISTIGSIGLKSLLFDGGYTFRHDSPINFNVAGLSILGYGATLTSPIETLTAVHNLTGSGMEVWGLDFIHSCSVTGQPYFNVGGTNIKLFDVSHTRPTANSSIPFYLRNTASGFQWNKGKLDAYGGLNSIDASDVTIDGVEFTQADAFSGVDDAISIKSITAVVKNWKINGCKFYNKADFVGIGSEIGTLGANDATYSKGVYNVLLTNCTGENCTYGLYIKPGATAYDYRDGTVQNVVVDNLTLLDTAGNTMLAPINITAARGARVRNVRATNISAVGRRVTSGAQAAGLAAIVITDSVPSGTTDTDMRDIYVSGSFYDPYDGAASGGAAPGNPFSSFVVVQKSNSAIGTMRNIRLAVNGNGCVNNAISIGPGIDDAVTVESANVYNVDVDGSGAFGGISSASRTYVSDSLNMNMAGGSSGKQFITSGSGEIKTRSKIVGLNEAILTLQNTTGAAGVGQGSISWTDSAGTEYAWIGDRDNVNKTLTVNGGTGGISLVAGSAGITASAKFLQTASNVTSSFTNSNANPTNIPVLQIVRTSNITGPSNLGAALLIQDNATHYPFTITQQNGTTVSFSIKGDGTVAATGQVITTGAGMGYATGAGGTVTQLTSKSTGVTLNKICGQVTMNSAALAAAAKVSFVVSNTTCAATDVPVVAVASGGTANAYRANVTAVAANSFTVTVENITAGSLSEAPVISFSIMKAVTA